MPRPARVEISIDEPRVARASGNPSVPVKIEWREPEDNLSFTGILAQLPGPIDLMVLKRRDGGVELVPKSWRSMRFGKEGSTFFELARRTPGGLGLVPGVEEASKCAKELIRQYLPDFDSYAPEEQAEFVLRTIEHSNVVSRAIEGLVKHLDYAAPGRKAVPLLKNPRRDVNAAILSEVHGWSTLRIGQELRISASDSEIKRENQAVRKIIERGRYLLEQCFGVKEWSAKVERMRAECERWESLGPKQQFYMLLAEEQGTSLEEEKRAALEDGFDKTLDEWIDASVRDEYRLAARIRLSDSRFGVLEKL